MSHRFSALILAGLGAGAIALATGGERGEAAPVDPAAVDRYIARLSETVPPPPAATLAKDAPEDPKLSKTAQRIDRAEPMIGAAFGVAR